MAMRNKMSIPSGMLAPAGLSDTPVNPNIQATTRPPGTLLPASPGYDSVRIGKNRFQGRGPTGGFRPFEFAEEIGGSGAALAIVPGDTSTLPETEWLPDESVAIISDRKHNPGWARWLHDGMGTMPDMGDRKETRPLSKAWFARLNPSNALREEYRQSPEVAVLMGAGLVYIIYLLAQEFERQVKGSSSAGPAETVTNVPASAARASGDVAGETVDKIGEAADKAVEAIENATDKAVDKIESTVKDVTD